MQLKVIKEEYIFFNLLPLEWQESIQPNWASLKECATIYVLEEENEIFAGGIVFSKITPEMDVYIEEAKYWFSKNYFYVGYVWVPLEKRNNNYGSLWLKSLLAENKMQHYWLTTEEKKLRYFYEKLGFKYIKTLNFNEISEELFVN